MFKLDGKYRHAHRVAYEVACGPIPEGLIVRHKCDNPACVNPEHLCLGTTQDNVGDRVKRGRGAVGERNANSKLSLEQVKEIKRGDYSEIGSKKKAAHKYGISQTALGYIVNGRTYKYVNA